jgi:hypothetical protein
MKKNPSPKTEAAPAPVRVDTQGHAAASTAEAVALDKRAAPSARATLYRIASLCAAAEKRLPEATDRAAVLALYLAAVRDAARQFWTAGHMEARP